jgi:hypothetical protein
MHRNLNKAERVLPSLVIAPPAVVAALLVGVGSFSRGRIGSCRSADGRDERRSGPSRRSCVTFATGGGSRSPH